jgi:signal transduction histidine kinase
MAKKKEITVRHNYAYQGDYVRADPLRLKQILVNLLDNAVKFSSHGQEIGLDVSGEEQDRQVAFTIWDSGVGIEPQRVADLFEPFVQADNPLIRAYGGTGLGLALVHRLVTMHQGEISVKSERGQGSAFTVHLSW